MVYGMYPLSGMCSLSGHWSIGFISMSISHMDFFGIFRYDCVIPAENTDCRYCVFYETMFLEKLYPNNQILWTENESKTTTCLCCQPIHGTLNNTIGSATLIQTRENLSIEWVRNGIQLVKKTLLALFKVIRNHKKEQFQMWQELQTFFELDIAHTLVDMFPNI